MMKREEKIKEEELIGLWFSSNIDHSMWEVIEVKENVVYLKRYVSREILGTSKEELLKYNRLNFEMWGKEKCLV